MACAISLTWVSSAKWPVSRNWTVALGLSVWKAWAPGGMKKGSFLPQMARSGGFDSRKYFWNDGIEFYVIGVVEEQIELDVHVAGALDHEGVEGVAFGRDVVGIGDSDYVLGAQAFGAELFAQSFAIFF